MREIAPGIAIIPTLIANAYLVGDSSSWVLIDACTPGNERRIQRAVARRFGPASRPRAILLTHGHFDHAGSAGALAAAWGVRVHAHPRELPYLTGRAHYPPMNLTGPGFFTRLARFFPTHTVNLEKHIAALDPTHPIPGLPDWELLETPGHTSGHVSFFRRADQALIAGDALTTMNLDSFWSTILQRRQVCPPPRPATHDWPGAHRSIKLLAGLHPSLIAAGHGQPMHAAAAQLGQLAEHIKKKPMGN